MEKHCININEDEMFNITNHFNKTQYLLTDAKDKSTIKFQSLKQANLYGNGINKINKQIEIISKTINKMNQTIKEKTNEIIYIDQKLNEEAIQIKVPTNFVTYNSVNSHMFKEISLSKNEGKQISKDNNLNENKLSFDSIIKKKNINNINNTNSNDNSINLKDYTGKEELLKNINNKVFINDINLYDDIEIKDEYFYDDFFDK